MCNVRFDFSMTPPSFVISGAKVRTFRLPRNHSDGGYGYHICGRYTKREKNALFAILSLLVT